MIRKEDPVVTCEHLRAAMTALKVEILREVANEVGKNCMYTMPLERVAADLRRRADWLERNQ